MRYYLIIDSNTKTIEFIQEAFSALSEYSCAGINSSFSLELNNSLKCNPELILINFDAISANPFKTIKQINKIFGIPPKYIVLTSCYKKAFKAYKKGAVDVVDKWETPKEIERAISRYHSANFPTKLYCIHYYYKYRYLHLDDILFLKADNYTTDFILKDGTILHGYKTLKNTHHQLPHNFQRIHRSYVINSYYVKRIDYGKKEIILHYSEQVLKFSKTYTNNIETVKRILADPENPLFGQKSIHLLP
ncbi:LytR/AlgR family response regulator transcription factor [Aequorivita aquimaris]|uniref:LytR/AlgR family response regulator transcription factor n=1 Tax=Aequorivita aquimaris TaxID=1548749 RepID=UPI0007876BC0|nr:LytTR family DNA-binding domain-containing protein [Aequorivita aquimaris]